MTKIQPQPFATGTNSHGGHEPLALGAVEAARLLGIGTRTLWTLTKRGEVPHIRIGRRVLYPLDGLRQWLAARTCGSADS